MVCHYTADYQPGIRAAALSAFCVNAKESKRETPPFLVAPVFRGFPRLNVADVE